jgi:hypothetical protein
MPEPTTIWACPSGHLANVARVPNAEGVRRCFFCPEVVVAKGVLVPDA